MQRSDTARSNTHHSNEDEDHDRHPRGAGDGSDGGGLDHMPVISALVMEFLDVKSLLFLGATSRHHRALLQQEVLQRKKRFTELRQALQECAHRLDRCDVADSHSIRETYAQAQQLDRAARNWIDSGVGRLGHPVEQFRRTDLAGICPICSNDPWFYAERVQIMPHRIRDIVSCSIVLPSIFYFSDRVSNHPNESSMDILQNDEERIEQARRYVQATWSLLRATTFAAHPTDVTENNTNNGNRYYWDPDVPDAQWEQLYPDYAGDTILENFITDTEAYRMAARRAVLREHHEALPTFLSMLLLADRRDAILI